MNNKQELKSLLEYFGGVVEFEKPIRFRLTPHSLTQLIRRVSLDTTEEELGDAMGTVLQRLRLMKAMKQGGIIFNYDSDEVFVKDHEIIKQFKRKYL